VIRISRNQRTIAEAAAVALVCISVAVFFWSKSAWVTLQLHAQTQDWVKVPATLYALDVVEASGETTTYSLQGRYGYEWQGQSYTSLDISLESNIENNDDWHWYMWAALKSSDEDGDLMARINPQAPQQSTLLSRPRWDRLIFASTFPLFLVFVGVMVFAAGWFIVRLRSPRKTPCDVTKHGAEVKDGVVYSNARMAPWWWVFGSGTMVILSVPGIAAAMMPWGNSLPDVLTFSMLTFAVLMAYLARRSHQKWLYYGDTPLILSPFPGQHNGHLGGEVCFRRTGLQADWKLLLQCVHTSRKSDREHSNKSILWQSETRPEVVEEDGETRVRFIFALDGSQPASSDKHRITWRLTLIGPTVPVNYQRVFEVPVVEGDALSELALSEAHRKAVFQEQREQAQESLSEDLEITTSAALTASEPVEELSQQSSQPSVAQSLDQSLEQAQAQSEHMHIHSRAGRHGLAGVIMTLLGAVVLIFGLSAISDVLLGSLMAFAVGGGFAGLGLWMLGRSLEATVRAGRVENTRYWMGIRLWQKDGCFTSADQLLLASAGSATMNGETQLFFNIGIMDDDATLWVAEQIEGEEAAKLMMEQLSQLLVPDELI